jgi:hypothetical protein
MRLFRQRKLGEWGEVIERMADALAGMVQVDEHESALVAVG